MHKKASILTTVPFIDRSVRTLFVIHPTDELIVFLFFFFIVGNDGLTSHSSLLVCRIHFLVLVEFFRPPGI